jgi:hypothetical protein
MNNVIPFHVSEYQRLARLYNEKRDTPEAAPILRQYQEHFWGAELEDGEEKGLLQKIREARAKLLALKEKRTVKETKA